MLTKCFYDYKNNSKTVVTVAAIPNTAAVFKTGHTTERVLKQMVNIFRLMKDVHAHTHI